MHNNIKQNIGSDTIKKKDYKQNMPVIEEDLIGIGNTSDFSKSIKEIFSNENIAKKTDLSEKQIVKLNLIKQMAEYYQVPLLTELYNRFIELRVSKERKGRNEAVTMTQQISTMKRLEGLEQMVNGGMKK